MEALTTYCPHLKELNLACLHIHSTNHKSVNRLCFLISTLKCLKALSIPACGLVDNVDAANEQDCRTSTQPFGKSSNYRLKTVSNLLFSVDASTACNLQDSANVSTYTTRFSRDVNDDLVKGTGLESIVKNCCMLEELEIIDTGFRSIFSHDVTDKFIWYVL